MFRFSFFVRASRTAFPWLLVSAAALGASPAHAEPSEPSSTEPSREACIDAHRNAQELRQKDKFLEARKQLLVCSNAACPGVLISDCTGWLEELEPSIPSLVFELTLDGHDATEARVYVDGEELHDWSQAYRVDPGHHTVRVELGALPAHEEEVVLREGQRRRVFAVQFKSPPPEKTAAITPAPAPVLTRPTPTLVYPLLALGVAGVGSFGTFAYLGRQKQHELEQTCSPNCDDAALKPMKERYLIGDLSLGVGAAALGGALLLYFMRPSTEEHPSGVELGLVTPGSSPNAAKTWGLTARGEF